MAKKNSGGKKPLAVPPKIPKMSDVFPKGGGKGKGKGKGC